MDEHTELKLYRRRHIPDELIHLKDDRILQYVPGQLLITEWKTLKPRKDFVRGVSAFFLDRGIKVSKLFNADQQATHWYCDIGMFHLCTADNSLTFEDLLFDVVVQPDGSYRVLDIGEAADAYQNGLITKEQLLYAMQVLDQLLETLHDGSFAGFQQLIDQACSRV